MILTGEILSGGKKRFTMTGDEALKIVLRGMSDLLKSLSVEMDRLIEGIGPAGEEIDAQPEEKPASHIDEFLNALEKRVNRGE